MSGNKRIHQIYAEQIRHSKDGIIHWDVNTSSYFCYHSTIRVLLNSPQRSIAGMYIRFKYKGYPLYLSNEYVIGHRINGRP